MLKDVDVLHSENIDGSELTWAVSPVETLPETSSETSLFRMTVKINTIGKLPNQSYAALYPKCMWSFGERSKYVSKINVSVQETPFLALFQTKKYILTIRK